MKLLLVDDHSLFRDGLAHLFNSQPDFEIVGEAGSIKETFSLLETQHPDIILMDMGLPDGSGLDAISRILQIKPNVNIVMLTIHASDESAFNALRSGAVGFLLKDISASALLAALRRLERGELAVSRTVLSRFVKEFLPFNASHGDRISGEITLTLREIEVLAELSNANSNAEIAHRLSISENTAKVHVHNILHKLKLQSRQEAAAYACRHGLRNNGIGLRKNQET